MFRLIPWLHGIAMPSASCAKCYSTLRCRMNMPQNDHERFEHFLRQFRPRAPRRLPIEKQERAARALALWALLASAAVMFAVAVFLSAGRREPKRLTGGV